MGVQPTEFEHRSARDALKPISGDARWRPLMVWITWRAMWTAVWPNSEIGVQIAPSPAQTPTLEFFQGRVLSRVDSVSGFATLLDRPQHGGDTRRMAGPNLFDNRAAKKRRENVWLCLGSPDPKGFASLMAQLVGASRYGGHSPCRLTQTFSGSPLRCKPEQQDLE